MMMNKEKEELWRKYCKLLNEELKETITWAYVHGWRSDRYEKGVELRSLLNINENCDDIKNS